MSNVAFTRRIKQSMQGRVKRLRQEERLKDTAFPVSSVRRAALGNGRRQHGRHIALNNTLPPSSWKLHEKMQLQAKLVQPSNKTYSVHFVKLDWHTHTTSTYLTPAERHILCHQGNRVTLNALLRDGYHCARGHEEESFNFEEPKLNNIGGYLRK